MEKKYFGKLKSGEDIYNYTLKNDKLTVEISEKGATVIKFFAGGKDIVGGFDNIEDYFTDTSYQGATVGRVANRIKNAEFTIDGKTYHLPKNDGENCLHGGSGFHSKKWTVTEYTDTKISLNYFSKDGEDGFPNDLDVTVTYSLISDALKISYRAVPAGVTPIALTNHSYFNLDGFGDTVKSHILTLYADSFTETDENLIPNGKRPAVKGTKFDFLSPTPVLERVDETFSGYDNNYILSSDQYADFGGDKLRLCAELTNGKLKMTVYTDQPGVQLYTGNFLGGGANFKGGIKPVKHGALCLETQTEPNCVNDGIGIYRKGEVYTHNTVYKVEKV